MVGIIPQFCCEFLADSDSEGILKIAVNICQSYERM